MGGLRTAHSVDHFFTHFDGRREGFRVSTENVAKVNYGEIPAKSMDEWGDSREGKVSYHGRNVLRREMLMASGVSEKLSHHLVQLIDYPNDGHLLPKYTLPHKSQLFEEI